MISFKKEDDRIVCIPKVNLVASNISSMRDRIIARIEGVPWKELIVDCSEVDTVDSIGVNLVVGLYKRAEASSAGFKLIGCNEAIKKVLNLFRLDQKFSVE